MSDLVDSILNDPREIRRKEVAWQLHEADDVAIPRLRYWNYDGCSKHAAINDCPDCTYELRCEAPFGSGHHPRSTHRRPLNDLGTTPCQHCGIIFRTHQRVGISWLYTVEKALLADSVGTGKTVHIGGLHALMLERGDPPRGEFNDGHAIVCARPQALPQHYRELHRMVPSLSIMQAAGTKKQRIDRYLQPWETCLIGYQMLLRDVDALLHFPIHTLIVDDVDALRNRENRTSWALKKIAERCRRVVIMTGTPLQKRLHELHSVLEPIGGRQIFGNEIAFMHRYVRTEQMSYYNMKTGRKQNVKKVVGYKNVDEFKQMIAPLALRRTASDINDVSLPTIQAHNVELELYPAQRDRYKELQAGVIKIIKEEGTTVKQATAMGKIQTGARICAGLPSLGEEDGPERAVKLDWLMDQLEEGDLSDEKVVVFAGYKDTIRAIQKRFQAARGGEGIGHVTIWGDDPDKQNRDRDVQRFWNDDKCQVLIGTQAIEQSLNLQVARHLVNIDMILNPARMEQLSGRIRRDGSAYQTVYVHNVLTVDTQEERYLPLLEREQALIDYVWDESSQLFEALNPVALLQLIAP